MAPLAANTVRKLANARRDGPPFPVQCVLRYER